MREESREDIPKTLTFPHFLPKSYTISYTIKAGMQEPCHSDVSNKYAMITHAILMP